MSKKTLILLALLALLMTNHGNAQTELITNGSFEAGNVGWSLGGSPTSAVIIAGSWPHSGTHYAVLGEVDNNHDWASQQITIPSNTTSATLTFWCNVTTESALPPNFDWFEATIRNTADEVLGSAAMLSNVNAQTPGVYTQYTYDLLPFAGQTIVVKFYSSTDGSLMTSFKVDDVSVSVVVPVTYQLTVNSANPSSGVGIGVEPDDIYGNGGGNTPFNRFYNPGTVVYLHNSSLCRWERNGVFYSNSEYASVTMDANYSFTAILAPAPNERTLTITCDGGDCTVDVSPSDNCGRGWDAIEFQRYYSLNSVVSLTAYHYCGDPVPAFFREWHRDGVFYSNNESISVVMDNDHTMKAVYGPPDANQAPSAFIDGITSPDTAGCTISLSGHGTDIDGSVAAYSWRSDRDGQLSTQASFSTSSLSVGPHMVYFRVQDNLGAWSLEVSASVFVTFTFVHLTDLHVGAQADDANVKKVIDEIRNLDPLHPLPSFIVATGDLIDGVSLSGYLAVGQQFCDNLDQMVILDQWARYATIVNQASPIPVYAVAGNHDGYSCPDLVPSSYKGDISLNPVPNLQLVNMFSGENASPPLPPPLPPPRGSGLTTDQLVWMQNTLQATPGGNHIVAMHHPLFRDAGGYFDEEGTFTTNREFFMDAARQNNVALVLAGHTHTDFGYWVNSQHHPTLLPYWTPWVTNDASIGDLPLYVVTDACGEQLAFRKFEVHENWVRAYPTTHVNNVHTSEYSVTTVMGFWKDVIPLSRAGSTGRSSIVLPATVHLYDSGGRHVGFNDTGSIDYEIADAYYSPEFAVVDSVAGTVGLIGQTLSVTPNTRSDYSMRIEASSPCTLIVVGKQMAPFGGGETDLYYPAIAVDSGAIATTAMIGGQFGSTLDIDDNGDGTVDRTVNPDSLSHNYLCGDASADVSVDISDAVYLISYIFAGGPAPQPLLAGDTNCDSSVDISDAVYLIQYIFADGPAPCAGCK